MDPAFEKSLRVAEDYDSERSQLDCILDWVYRGDDVASNTAEENTRKQNIQKNIDTYGGMFLKTAALFYPQAFGGFATALLYGLDEIKVNSSFETNAVNLFLGMGKGLLTRTAFSRTAALPGGFASHAVALGMSSRFIDSALTLKNYEIDESGRPSFTHGMAKAFGHTFNPLYLGTDVAAFGLGHLANKGINEVSNGFLQRSPLAQFMATGATYGFSSGTTSELARQINSGEKLDFGKAAKEGAIHMGIGALAAFPGGAKYRFNDHFDTGVIDPRHHNRDNYLEIAETAVWSMDVGNRLANPSYRATRSLMSGKGFPSPFSFNDLPKPPEVHEYRYRD